MVFEHFFVSAVNYTQTETNSPLLEYHTLLKTVYKSDKGTHEVSRLLRKPENSTEFGSVENVNFKSKHILIPIMCKV
jgi:hypothetical protein